MSRQLERLMRRALTGFSCVLLIAAAALIATVFLSPDSQKVMEFGSPAPKAAGQAPLTADPRVSKLASARMTRTLVQKPEMVTKPPAPELHTLLRLKGILSYGDPKDNEALLEIIRINQIKTFKKGETVQEVNATITSIDSAVTFNYDGKTVKLEIRNGERADAGSIATPNGPGPVAGSK